MTDYFNLLAAPRRPWLDVEKLKVKFLALAAEAHPDRFHNAAEAERQAANARHQELNAAYHCLREPKERLRHLLELETGAPPANIQQAPARLMDLFFEIGQLSKTVDGVLVEKARAGSPLLKVKWMEAGLEHLDRIHSLQAKVFGFTAALEEELKELDANWAADAPGLLRRVDEIYREWSFLSRWSAQLQERTLQLAL